ncbi:MAG: hypothetical protein Phog2KO_07990 [Phototrophicaceae bacterium]
MPDSFFSKLNTLVQGHINNIVDPIDEETGRTRKKALSRKDIRGGLQKDVKLLRQRIDDALAYEGELQAKADGLYSAIAEWDDKANQAVNDGRENDARYALGQMQQSQRELEMIEADLREHRTITQELISQVNMLDSTIQEVEGEDLSDAPIESQTSVDEIGAQIVQQLDSTRQNLSNLISEYTAKVTGEDKPVREDEDVDIPIQRSRTSSTVKHPIDKNKVDDEYSARISRLSKPDDKK